MLAERADLVARLSLDDQFSRKLDVARGSLGKFGSSISKAASTAALNIARVGTVAAVGLAAGIRGGLDSLATLEDAVTSVDGAISTLGLTGQITGKQIADWANDIERNVEAAFDDKAITQASATLLRFGKVTPANLRPAMEVMTDLATKTGDVDSAAALLARALADPTAAAGKLARAGVVLTDETQNQIKAMVKSGDVAGAQSVLLRELEKTTRGAAKASAGPFRDSLNIFKDVVEDAQRALAVGFLPVISKVADLLNKELAKPGTLERIRDFGKGIAGGLDSLIETARGLPWADIGNALRIGGDGAKAIVGAFTGLPSEAKATILALAGLNKLTGGMVLKVGVDLVQGVFGQFFARGASPANAMWVKMVGGAVGGGVGGAAAGAAGMGAAAFAAIVAASGAALVVALQQAWTNPDVTNAIKGAVHSVFPALPLAGQADIQAQSDKNQRATQAIIATGDLTKIMDALNGTKDNIASLTGLQKVLYDLDAAGNRSRTAETVAALERARIAIMLANDGTESLLRANLTRPQPAPIVNVKVTTNVTARTVSEAQWQSDRYASVVTTGGVRAI